MPTFEFLSTVRNIIDADTYQQARDILEVELGDACFSIESVEDVR